MAQSERHRDTHAERRATEEFRVLRRGFYASAKDLMDNAFARIESGRYNAVETASMITDVSGRYSLAAQYGRRSRQSRRRAIVESLEQLAARLPNLTVDRARAEVFRINERFFWNGTQSFYARISSNIPEIKKEAENAYQTFLGKFGENPAYFERITQIALSRDDARTALAYATASGLMVPRSDLEAIAALLARTVVGHISAQLGRKAMRDKLTQAIESGDEDAAHRIVMELAEIDGIRLRVRLTDAHEDQSG